MTEYYRPVSTVDAVRALSEAAGEGKLLAGGLALGPLLRSGFLEPKVIIDIREMPDLCGISVAADGTVLIGAATTHRELELSQEVRRGWPVIAEMEGLVGSLQVRNNGTIGGNLCHADPAEDPPATLICLDARVRLLSPRGERTLLLEDFFRGYLETALEPDEMATQIEVPPLPVETGCAYLKHAKRAAVDFPIVGAAAKVTLRGGRIVSAKVVLAAVHNTPWVCRAADLLVNQAPTEALLGEFGRQVVEEINPVGDTSASGAYKKHAAGVLARRAVAAALARAGGPVQAARG